MRLTEKKIARLNEPGRYRDGNGLLLQITNTGAKSWIFRYERDKRERWMGLGPCHTFNLHQARRAARSARELLFLGVDPIEARLSERDSKKASERSRITFKQASQRFLDLHGVTWKNEKHANQWKSTLETYAFPVLGPRPISAINDALINEALAAIWARIPETAKRVRHRIKKIKNWVEEGMPLPTTFAKRRVKNHAALPYRELPAFMAELRAKKSISARALEFLILTASRTGEVIGARWPEFNFEDKIWTVPAERMKSAKEHRVPLSDRALEILEGLPRELETGFVFIGASKGRPISNMAMLELMRGMRPGYVPHGFRSCFRDWSGDTTAYPNHVCEMALAHIVQGVEGAYRRSDLLEKRRHLMRDWATYCRSKLPVENVVALRANKAA